MKEKKNETIFSMREKQVLEIECHENRDKKGLLTYKKCRLM